jgi:hypothetical protein
MGHKQLVMDDPSKEYPEFLKSAISSKSINDTTKGVPLIIDMSIPGANNRLKKFIESHRNIDIIDNYAEQYAELILSKHAHLYRANYNVQISSIADMLESHYCGKPSWQIGNWVFFPWKNKLVHVLDIEYFGMLGTIRNRNLITPKEQSKLLNFHVAVFGMSVGSASSLALAISGISREIKLIDGAVISGSNLNRIITGVSSVGKSKALVISQMIYEMNPYSSVSVFDKATSSNIRNILDKDYKLDMVVDEIDDMEMKVRIRVEARMRKIPVVMATELGDTVMLDVERYDIEPNRPIFHGMVPGIEKLLNAPINNYREWTKHAVGIIDANNMPLKMQKTLLKVGSTIVTHPQLGSTVMMTGGVVAFAAKHIATSNDLRSGRYVISLERSMLADHKTHKYKRDHKRHTKVLIKSVSSM